MSILNLSAGVNFALGFGVGVGVSYLCYAFFPTAQRLCYQLYQAYSDPEDLGVPFKTDHLVLLKRNGYYLAFDERLRAARWTLHRLTRVSITARLVERRPAFEVDSSLPSALQIPTTLYEGMPWDRGHLVPSEDINYSAESCKQTFLMSNVVPQDPRLNRNAWKSLEFHIRQWAEVLGDLHVVTGAFFGKRPRRLNQTVAIPKGFYKVIYSERVHRALAIYCPNKPLDAHHLWRDENLFSVSALEAKLSEGDNLPYRFFPLITGDERARIEDDCDIEYWLSLLSRRRLSKRAAPRSVIS